MPESVSSKTPDGFPVKCSICGATVVIHVSALFDDGCCPQCGVLLSSHMIRLIPDLAFLSDQCVFPVPNAMSGWEVLDRLCSCMFSDLKTPPHVGERIKADLRSRIAAGSCLIMPDVACVATVDSNLPEFIGGCARTQPMTTFGVFSNEGFEFLFLLLGPPRESGRILRVPDQVCRVFRRIQN